MHVHGYIIFTRYMYMTTMKALYHNEKWREANTHSLSVPEP